MRTLFRFGRLLIPYLLADFSMLGQVIGPYALPSTAFTVDMLVTILFSLLCFVCVVGDFFSFLSGVLDVD